ncbi:hypothetical protein CPB97_007703 [Podila verticillata]|nr:hypothetical protein CPB97_007703 [Podila verticillata]
MVAPFLYQSPMALIDATWPKLSQYCQVLRREPEEPVQEHPPPFSHASSPAEPSVIASSPSLSFNERVGRGTDPGVDSSRVPPRTQSRSSSHSSTRSLTVDVFNHGRHEAVHERDRLIRKKKLQVLWLLLNCTITDQEYEEANSPQISTNETFMSLERRTDLDVSVDYFKPATDYLSLYTHYYHPGLRNSIWRLFPAIEDASLVEQRLITHNPERIRELFLESVQLQDIIFLAPRMSCLYRIRTCHESWDIHGCIDFMTEHNALFGTVRMLELEAYLPDSYDTPMENNVNELVATVDHLRTLELSGFETLRTDLERIPRADLKVLRLNCGSLSPTMTPRIASTTTVDSTTGSKADEEPMNVNRFLSQCRKLEELFLKAIDEDMLGWAVTERRNLQAAQQTCPSSPSSLPLSNTTLLPLVPLRTIELSGTDSEHVAMTISQAAEAFQDTLQVIKANSYSYLSNRSLTSLTWKCPMPRLEVIKIVGRSNLPFDFRSLQYCPALKNLDISKYSGMRACSEALLLNMCYLTQLEYLGLSSFDHLTDSTVRTILGCMPRLKHLRLALRDTPAWNMSGSSSAASSSGGSSMPNPSSSSSPMSSAASSVQENMGITSGMRITGMTGDLNSRLNFAAMSVSSQSPAPSSTSSTSPSAPMPTQLGSQGYKAMSLPPPLPGSSSLRPSLMDRFHMENNYLSLDGILDAIRGLRESKRLEKLSIVLPKVDFEENFHRLEMYNLQHPDLEIVVYRYAHAV